MTPEGKITKQIIDYLKMLRALRKDIWWIKLHGGPMQEAGVPDLLVILDGAHFFFEIKKPGAKATPLQQIQMDRINLAGGKALVVHSAGEVKLTLTEIPRVNKR
jgi:predicted type IV restriction endonuclease